MRNRIGAAGALLAVAAGGVWLAAGSIDGRVAHAAASASTGAPKRIHYGRDIRPILSDRCFTCHGQDAQTRAADLRLDEPLNATAPRDDGKAAIVPGTVEASELWRRITSDDPKYQMPPPGSNKRALSLPERELVRQWIEQGAAYESHWSFVPPVRSALPEVKAGSWCRNEIDRFILAGLEQEGVAPSVEAPREVLVRRIFLDLTGLPPLPEEIDAFLADQRPDAYERWIDKLMTVEPYRTRYAERMAVPWLDAARYADTSGIHMDAGRQTWLWRDGIIQSFRDNQPFDRFVMEQIAGDLLPEATVAQKIASGFNRNHVTTDEGGAIAAEYLVEYAVDRTNTTGSVFLGLGVGCARCHDHKYDPISQKDYYGLYAFFDSIEEPGLYSQAPDPQRALEPFLVVPTKEQEAELSDLRAKIGKLAEAIKKPTPQEDQQFAAFQTDLRDRMMANWTSLKPIEAKSAKGATLTIQEDGSVLASGPNPDKDEHIITLRTDEVDLRVLLLEALAHSNLPNGRVGRAPNGNAVLSDVAVEAVSVADPSKKQAVPLIWAWSDYEQDNGDFRVANILGGSADGWAVNGHEREGGRAALLLSKTPFGFEGGTELHVRLKYNSIYAQHTFGCVRLRAASICPGSLDLLPTTTSNWYMAGPFPAESTQAAYEKEFGPQADTAIKGGLAFAEKLQWRYNATLKDGLVNALPDGVNAVHYVGQRIFSPTRRRVEVSLGSDDGFALFVNGRQVAARQINRGAAADQEKVTIDLQPGLNALVMKIVNTGGPGGFYHRAAARPEELGKDLVGLLMPDTVRPGDLAERIHQGWRTAYLPEYRERVEQFNRFSQRTSQIEASAPRTMVMKELPKPRETFVLTRGQYDKPDPQRPVTRAVPAFLGKLPDKAPLDRRGLAEWLISADNPLTARVAANRLWELLFGTGLVRTSEDFGLQGDWPSHPELLDWLAVEYRTSGWNVQHMLRLIMTSSTYRQQSNVRPELRDRDPNNRLLAWFPRRRLAAEFVRDQALYVAGLLIEKAGGPSVKPYQPDGLWQEVAMVQSNTRIFVRGNGEDLWRRSMYTYWKRACPPPSLMSFDAPTREACTIRRSNTNTPLQALALCNDEQYVEAARVLATRTLRGPGDDGQRVANLFRCCTGHAPAPSDLERILQTLEAFRQRYRKAPEDAAKLIEVGDAPVPKDTDAPELAAWTLIANAALNLSETITQR